MNQIKVGAIVSYISIALNILTGLIFTPWMINSIGKDNYGIYTLVMSVITLFIFDFGLGNSVARFVSKYLSENRQDKVDNLLGLVFKLYLIGDIIVLLTLIIVYFCIPQLYHGLTASEITNFRNVYVIAAIFCIISFPFLPLNGIISSYEKFIKLKLCDLAHKVIIVVLVTICLLLGGGLFSLVIVNSIAGIVVILLKLSILGKDRILSINWKFKNKNLLYELFYFSVWIMIIQLSQRCIFSISPSIVASYVSSAAIAIIGIAIVLEGYTFTFANAINGMFLPRVSRHLAEDNRESILNLMIRVGRIQIFLIGFICVCFIILGQDFIYLWLGDGYSEVYCCALMIILPSFFHLPQEIGCTAIVAEGKVKYQAIAFIVMALLNIILAFPLSKLYGVYGLCFSIMLSYFVRTILLDIIIKKELKLDIMIFFSKTFKALTPSIILALVVIYFVITCIGVCGWLGFIIKGCVSFILYFTIIWMFAMNDNEKNLIINSLRKIKAIY